MVHISRPLSDYTLNNVMIFAQVKSFTHKEADAVATPRTALCTCYIATLHSANSLSSRYLTNLGSYIGLGVGLCLVRTSCGRYSKVLIAGKGKELVACRSLNW